MRETLLLLLVAAAFCVGCASTTNIRVDQREVLSPLRTWNWLPTNASPELGVNAPHRNAPVLHNRLERLIAQELGALGFERVDRADFFVVFQLVLVPRRVTVYEPRAPYLLSSMTSSASYWIEGSNAKILVFEEFRLVIGLFSKPGQIFWRGVLERQVEEGENLSLGEAVAELLERLPPPTYNPPAGLDREIDPPPEPNTPELPTRDRPHLS